VRKKKGSSLSAPVFSRKRFSEDALENNSAIYYYSASTIIRLNRRASNHRSPLARIPLDILCSNRGDLLIYQEHDATSSPQDNPFTSALDDPILVSLPGHSHAVPDPRWKIPPSAWKIVLQRVEQGEPLRHIARGDARVVRGSPACAAGRSSPVSCTCEPDHPRGQESTLPQQR